MNGNATLRSDSTRGGLNSVFPAGEEKEKGKAARRREKGRIQTG